MDRIQLRRDSSARWAEINPILLEGEVGFETDTKLRKIGDGVNRWNDLEYLKAEGIVQETGDSENATMSQKAITRKLSELASKVNQYGRTNNLYDYIIDGNIASTNKWLNIGKGEYFGVIIPVVSGEFYGLLMNDDLKRYAWLTSNEIIQGETPSYVSSMDIYAQYNSNIVISIQAPDDAKYLYLSCSLNGEIVMPYLFNKRWEYGNKNLNAIIVSGDSPYIYEDEVKFNGGKFRVLSNDGLIYEKTIPSDLSINLVSGHILQFDMSDLSFKTSAQEDNIGYGVITLFLNSNGILYNGISEKTIYEQLDKKHNESENKLSYDLLKSSNEVNVVVRNGNISFISGVWANIKTNVESYKHIVMPISSFIGYNIKVNGDSAYKKFAFLTSLDAHEGTTPNYVEGTTLNDGYPNYVTVPEGSVYLYLTVSDVDGVVKMPIIEVDGVLIETYLRDSIKDLKLGQSKINRLESIIEGSDEEFITLNNEDVQLGNISGGLIWVNTTNEIDKYKHIVIPTSSFVGRKISVSGDCIYKYYAWLSNYTNISNGSPAAFVEGTTRNVGYPNNEIIPNDAEYLYLSVADSDGVIYLPIVSIAEEIGLKDIVVKNGTKGEKVVFSIDVNCSIDTSSDLTYDTEEDYKKDWATLSLPETYSLQKPTPLIIYCHGAGGSVNEAGAGESDGRVPFWNHYGYAVLQVNGLPSIFQSETVKGGGFGTPIAVNCYYKAYKYAIENYNILKDCYLVGESMGGLTAFNLMQNTPINIRAIALDSPLVSIKNLWEFPTWTQGGDKRDTVWKLFAKIYNFSFDELNEELSTSYTIESFPFNIDDVGYNYENIQKLYLYNKDKICGFDPFIPTSTNDDVDFKYSKCPIKIWRGSGDSPTNRLPYCKEFVTMLKNAGCYADSKYPPYSIHVLSAADSSTEIPQVVVGDKQYSVYLEEIRLWLERF